MGKISTGIFISSNNGFKSDNTKSKKPLFINRLIASIIAINVGNKLVIIPKLSFTPSINTSYISTFFKNPCNTIKRTNKGIIKFDI